MKALIFVLEDDPTELELLTQYLKTFIHPGDVILTAERGEKAIELIKQSDPMPGVFILDLNMPGKINGKGVLRWISEQEELEPCAKIILSSSTNPKDRQDCFSLGCTEFKTKPRTLEETKVIIKNLLKKYRDRQPLPSQQKKKDEFHEISQRFGDIFDD